MKIAKYIALPLMVLATSFSYSQDLELTAKDSTVTSSWIFGVGWNAVDDAGSEFENLFAVGDNWNFVPFPSRVSVGRYFKNGFGLEAIGSYNRYKEGKTIDGIENPEDIDYYAIDLRASYDLNQILGDTGWFDPYVGIGVGYTDANNQGRGTYNAAVGFRTWISDQWGLDFNSTGKWTMNRDNSTNHIQHAAGVVYRFGIEKELSRKGQEKLAMIEEMEREQQRVQDSIAEAQRLEEEARLLAERLKKEEEEARLAMEEKARLDARNTMRKGVEDAVSALGYVYFDLNSSYLNANDKALLDALVAIIEEHPSMAIRVGSHTDARGTDTYNLWLSDRRLQRTVDYLMTKGVATDRILSKAYGETQLTNECDDNVRCSESKHRENRRSEFGVVWTDE
ncbi:OmpA family protein [Flagellimonas sp. DF-77]|uniref:OmpA family protein n=1 Tax=Flagellimonas algarum TaxID=3230298 RepID=UPI003397B0F6